MACSDPDDREPAPDADWVIALDRDEDGRPLTRSLLGHYDLSGELYSYNEVPGLADALEPAGFDEWRFGVGRWEAGTFYLPTLTDGSPCPESSVPEAYAPSGWGDDELMLARDWFVDDGQPVTLADTARDDRYALDYLRRFLNVADALGAKSFLSVDHMPRALAANRIPLRSETNTPTACVWSYANQVSNTRPRDPEVFAAAVVGMVQRIVEGSDGEPGREVTYWELWNEPDLCVFWDSEFEDQSPCVFDPFEKRLGAYLDMVIPTLAALDEYRRTSSHPFAKQLRFGVGSFAFADVAAWVLDILDAERLPGGERVPLDFISFHSYNHEPLGIIDFVQTVATARQASEGYRDVEMILAEWGPFPDQPFDADNMDQPLRMATVLAIAPALGLDRAHHTIFYDYWGNDVVKWGLLKHGTLEPRPLFHAYELLNDLIGDGATMLTPGGYEDHRIDGDVGAVLAGRGDDGATRVLLINRSPETRTARIDAGGRALKPRELKVFDDPTAPIRAGDRSRAFEVPPRSLVLATF